MCIRDRDIPFPKGCIVVSITRGGDYILADEDITINYADQIHMLMDSKNCLLYTSRCV